MKKFLLAGALAAALLAVRPAESRRWLECAQPNHGFCWLQGKALNFLGYNHFHGPLYNYGPYEGPGYAWMFVANPWFRSYTPALPVKSFGGYAVAPWSNFNYLPYPAKPPGGVANYPPYAYPPGFGPPPLAAGAPSLLEPPDFSKSVEQSKIPSAMPSATPAPRTSNYYGGPTPSYFRPTQAN